MSEFRLREAVRGDAEEIARIYNEGTLREVGNYESIPQSADARATWLDQLRKSGHFCLVVLRGNAIVAFGALTPFHPAPGYRKTVTGSLYVESRFHRSGVGSLLGKALIQGARERGFHSILAGIQSENTASIKIHEKFGFRQVGYFPQIGFKNGKWCDDVCMQLILE